MASGSGPETDRELDFYNEGFEDGYNQGVDGYNEAIDQYNAGVEAGYGQGFDEGYDDGRESVGFLARVAEPACLCLLWLSSSALAIVMTAFIVVHRLL